MERRMTRSSLSLWVVPIAALGALAGCAPQPAPSQAAQANLASCTAQADAVYQQDNLNGLARTSQNGLLYPATPDQVFTGQRMGTLNARDNQIQDCVDNGNPNNRPAVTAPLPAPQIIGNP
jgi:hypothetical protein